MKKWQIIFHSGNYSCIDGEATSYEQACEIKAELQAQMYLGGERDFFYEIKEIKGQL